MNMATLPEAVLFGTMIRRSGCACGVVRGMTMTVIGLLCLLAATVCVACAFVNKE